MKKNCPGNPFCDSLDPETRKILCKHATISFQMPKQIQTEHSDYQLEIIAKGVLVKYTLYEDGSQESIEVLGEGDIVNEHLLLWGNPSLKSSPLMVGPNHTDFQTMALTKVTKCIYPIEVIRTLFDENKPFSQTLLQNLANHLLKLQKNVMKARTLGGIEKIEITYRVLENLDVDMKLITQEDLALIAGVSRNTVVRALKKIHQET